MREVQASFDPARIMRSLEVAATTPVQETPAEEKRRPSLPIIARVALVDATYMPEPVDGCMGNTFERPRFPLLDARLTREFMVRSGVRAVSTAKHRLEEKLSELELDDTFAYVSSSHNQRIHVYQLEKSKMWIVSLIPSADTSQAYARERAAVFRTCHIDRTKTRPSIQSNLIVGATKHSERAKAIASILLDHGPYVIKLGPPEVLSE